MALTLYTVVLQRYCLAVSSLWQCFLLQYVYMAVQRVKSVALCMYLQKHDEILFTLSSLSSGHCYPRQEVYNDLRSIFGTVKDSNFIFDAHTSHRMTNMTPKVR